MNELKLNYHVFVDHGVYLYVYVVCEIVMLYEDTQWSHLAVHRTIGLTDY